MFSYWVYRTFFHFPIDNPSTPPYFEYKFNEIQFNIWRDHVSPHPEKFLSLGKKIYTNKSVKTVIIEKDRAVGIELEDGAKVLCDHVISTVDTNVLFSGMLDKKYMPKLLKEAYADEKAYPVISGFQVAFALKGDFSRRGTVLFDCKPFSAIGRNVDRLSAKIYDYDEIYKKDGKTAMRWHRLENPTKQREIQTSQMARTLFFGVLECGGDMTRQEQKEARRKDILMKALELFVTRGYYETKISDIADSAQMSVGLLFHYFKSKEELYIELVKMGVDGTRHPEKLKDLPPEQFFVTFLNQLFAYAKEQPWVFQMFVLMGQAAREGMPEEARNLSSSIGQIAFSAEIIKKGQQDGVFRQGDPVSLSTCFWASVQGVMEQMAATGDFTPEAEWLVSLLKK